MAITAQEINAMLGAIRRNPSLVRQIQDEIDALIADVMLSESGGTEFVNGSGNGMAFTAQITLSKRERLGLLQKVLDHHAAGVTAGSYAKTRFG
jgi:hypothetical protein